MPCESPVLAFILQCDEIEPRHYWTQISFPTMRDKRLVCCDFFDGGDGFNDNAVVGRYDLVVGNAPWGDGLATEFSNQWAASNKWEVANKDIGGLFLAKGARMVHSGGQVAMVQSANALLFNASGPARRFRRQLFTRHRVDAVFNLSALRFKVFKRKTHTTRTSIAPTCVVVLRPDQPRSQDLLLYASPKRLDLQIDDFTIVIEPHSIHRVPVDVARDDFAIWTTLMWGMPRDAQLLRKLGRFPRMATLKAKNEIKSRQGVVFGNRTRPVPELDGRRLFVGTHFPQLPLMELDASNLSTISDFKVHSKDSTDFRAFSAPQLLIKQGYQASQGRFQARLVVNSKNEGIICSKSYISATGSSSLMRAACFVYNSLIATYFMQLRSGRMAAYRPEANVHEILDVPIPAPEPLAVISAETLEEIDQAVFASFGLKDAERILVEDMVKITIPDFRGDRPSPGSSSTYDISGEEPILRLYCESFSKVLKAGFGISKDIGATIFTCSAKERAPYRLVAIELRESSPRQTAVQLKAISHIRLIRELKRLTAAHPTGSSRILGQRFARFYDGSSGTPTIFMLKPDAVRYWTRSMALNDADAVSGDLFQWMAASRGVSV